MYFLRRRGFTQISGFQAFSQYLPKETYVLYISGGGGGVRTALAPQIVANSGCCKSPALQQREHKRHLNKVISKWVFPQTLTESWFTRDLTWRVTVGRLLSISNVSVNTLFHGTSTREYHVTENCYIINSETIMDVNNCIPFSIINSQTIVVM